MRSGHADQASIADCFPRSKLADWDDDDPQTLHETNSRWDKVVILKHMFTLKELEEDPAAILDIKEDIRDECSKLGQVTNVVLFDKEIDGIASVRFAHHESAQACVRVSSIPPYLYQSDADVSYDR